MQYTLLFSTLALHFIERTVCITLCISDLLVSCSTSSNPGKQRTDKQQRGVNETNGAQRGGAASL